MAAIWYRHFGLHTVSTKHLVVQTTVVELLIAAFAAHSLIMQAAFCRLDHQS
jgi:hypothetical protein